MVLHCKRISFEKIQIQNFNKNGIKKHTKNIEKKLLPAITKNCDCLPKILFKKKKQKNDYSEKKRNIYRYALTI